MADYTWKSKRPLSLREHDRKTFVKQPIGISIAAVCAIANAQHWPAATLRTAMFTHLDQTLSEATHRLKGDSAADVKDYDAIEQHILTMADMLSDGIVAQFPQKFSAAKKSASR